MRSIERGQICKGHFLNLKASRIEGWRGRPNWKTLNFRSGPVLARFLFRTTAVRGSRPGLTFLILGSMICTLAAESVDGEPIYVVVIRRCLYGWSNSAY